MRILALLAAVVLASGVVRAVPAVSGVNDATPGDGQGIIVTGTGFGTKSPASPVIWDNFDSGTVGVALTNQAPVVGGTWSTYSSHSTHPVYSTTVLRTGSARSIFHDFEANAFNVSYQVYHASPTLYFTFWWYYSDTGTLEVGNKKPWEMYGSGSGDQPLIYTGFGAPPEDSYGWRISVQDSPAPGQPAAGIDGMWGDVGIGGVEDQWVRMECWLTMSTPGVYDGTYDCRLQRAASNHSMTDTTARTRLLSNFWDQLQIGSFQRHSAGMTSRVYTDDFYFDTTRARVEICNQSTWTASTICEIQLPTAWSATSITYTTNQGALTGTSWLYVVDSAGAVNANGFAITFGNPTPQCADSIDNDSDGDQDFPADDGCTDANDNDERRCGDGFIDTNESCDTAALGGANCISQGYGGGALTCSGCVFDESDCVDPCAVLSRSGWTVTCDSQETVGESGQCANAIDANTATLWVTQYTGSTPLHPHYVKVNTGSTNSICGFKYRPRTDGGVNGIVRDWRFYTAATDSACPDGGTWTLRGAGTFGLNTQTPYFTEQTHLIGTPVDAQFACLVTDTSYRDLGGSVNTTGPWTSLSDFNLLGEPADPPPAIACTVSSVSSGASGLDDGTTANISLANCGAARGLSKVELGNNATYASATKVEQTINTWVEEPFSTQSVNITVELGAFSCSTPLWVFVTRASDSSVSAGFPVTACDPVGQVPSVGFRTMTMPVM